MLDLLVITLTKSLNILRLDFIFLKFKHMKIMYFLGRNIFLFWHQNFMYSLGGKRHFHSDFDLLNGFQLQISRMYTMN